MADRKLIHGIAQDSATVSHLHRQMKSLETGSQTTQHLKKQFGVEEKPATPPPPPPADKNK